MGVSTYQTKEGRLYKAILYMDGTAVASKRGFKTKREARAWLTEEERSRLSPLPQTSSGTAFSLVAAQYLNDAEIRRQHNTYRYKSASINRLLKFMGGDFNLESITRQDIEEFAKNESYERGAKSANRDIRELKAVLNWAISKDIWQSNPFRTIEPYPETKFVRYVPPAEDVQKVRDTARGHESDFVEFLYFTGARLSEGMNLLWEDIDWRRGTVTLWTRKRKGGAKEHRVISMTQTLHEIMLARFSAEDRHGTHVFYAPNSGRVLTRTTAWTLHLFDRLCDEAGVKRFTAHCIRHFVATRLKDSRQATPFQIQHFLGHQSITTTEKYLHELDVDRGVVSILEGVKTVNSDKIEPQIEPQS